MHQIPELPTSLSLATLLDTPPPASYTLLQEKFKALSTLALSKQYLTLLISLHDLIDLLDSDSDLPKLLQEYEACVQTLNDIDGGKLDGVKEAMKALRLKIATKLEKRLHASLFTLGWPKPLTPSTLDPTNLSHFHKCLSDNLSLPNPFSTDASDTSSPLHSILNLLIMSIRYHFRDPALLRADKPEWLLSHTLKVYHSHVPFLTFIQKVHHVDLMNMAVKVFSEYVSSVILKALRATNFELLAHVLEECRQFDEKIGGGVVVKTLAGHWEVLGAWVELERNGEFLRSVETNALLAAVLKLNNVLDDEFAGTGRAASADLLIDLCETITARYESLPPRLQLEFFTHVQHYLFDLYTNYVLKTLTRLDNLFIPITRDGSHVQTSLTRISTLCRIGSSLAFLVRVVESWDQEFLFLDMWEEKRRIEECNSVWGGVVEALNGGRTRWIRVLEEVLSSFMGDAIEEFKRKRDWDALPDNPDLALSPELVAILTNLTTLLPLLKSNLDTSSHRTILKSLGARLETEIKESVLTHEFSRAGGVQLAYDVKVLGKVFNVYMFPVIGEIATILGGSMKEVQEVVAGERELRYLGKEEAKDVALLRLAL
ncbi:TIP-1 family-domain-containing protein [Chytridium lagenaria]|nr:TIP-1 family-domain-containing protein [Chytridium lagenaria]